MVVSKAGVAESQGLFTLFLIMRSRLSECQSRRRKMYGIVAQTECLRKKHNKK